MQFDTVSDFSAPPISQCATETNPKRETFLWREERAVRYHFLIVWIPREDQPQGNVQNRNRESKLASKRCSISRKKVLPGAEWFQYREHFHRRARRLNLAGSLEALFHKATRIVRAAYVEERRGR